MTHMSLKAFCLPSKCILLQGEKKQLHFLKWENKSIFLFFIFSNCYHLYYLQNCFHHNRNKWQSTGLFSESTQTKQWSYHELGGPNLLLGREQIRWSFNHVCTNESNSPISQGVTSLRVTIELSLPHYRWK